MSPAPASSPQLETAFADHYAFVRERLRCLGVAAEDLDDAAQDVFEVLVRRIADYDPARPIRAWMAGMARRVARRYRDRGRRSLIALDERRATEEPSPEARAAQAEAWALLQRFVDELEPERWSVFVLSEIEGLRGSEIAAELGLNQNTVYARLRSARSAFERTLQRHRARERRGLRAILVWPTSWRWGLGGSVTVAGSVALGSMIMLAMGNASCSAAERSSKSSRPRASSESTKLGPAPSVAARSSDPATSKPSETASPETNGWYSGGSGFSTNHNAKGEQYTLSVENRYRLEGDQVIFERTYIADDDAAIDSVETKLTLDGLELVDGHLEWELAIAAGEIEVVSTTLRASREGVVQLQVGSAGGSRTFKWINEGDRLRRCGERECEAMQATEERLSGERIRVHVHNKCEVAKEFVLFAGYPELLPPDSVAIHSLQPDERRVMELDAAQWFLHRDGDGRIGGGVHTDEDGAHLTFFGSGDDCSTASTQSPNL